MVKCISLVISGLLWLPVWGLAQNDSLLQAEIDAQIWRTFIQAYNTFDAEQYNNIHTAGVLRGGPWGLLEGEAYHQNNRTQFAANKANGLQRRIAFTFEHRVHRDSVAYEVGYYRVISESASGKQHTSYGQFHVVLRKEDGVWKIAQDWDAGTLNGVRITLEDFTKHAAKGVYE
ncbi:MAG: nuclear transport factor 2 family protein [Saprospiraceae bacterium]|jgi:ketosteroid isomerase-like protein|nr:nuclear transport factor 2 family protein [Lewinellaceae bacterium]